MPYIDRIHHRPLCLLKASQRPLHQIRPFYLQLCDYSTPRPSDRKHAPPSAQKTSSTLTASRLSPPTTSIPIDSRRIISEEALNPPSSTLPPPLNLPIPDPSVPFYKHYYRLGRAYLAFYKTGFKAIYSNFRLAESSNLKSANSSPLGAFSSVRSIQAAVLDGTITRARYHLFLRVRSDISRIPLFGLLFCICGEFTPLLVVFVSPIVPKILWLPRQWDKARIKAKKRRDEARKDAVIVPLGVQEVREVDASSVNGARWVKGTAKWMGAYPELWDRLFGGAVPFSVLKSRLHKKVQENEVDDFAIERDGGVPRLSPEEVKIACDMRGLDVLEREDGDMRRDLSKWLEDGRKIRNRESGRGKAAQ